LVGTLFADNAKAMYKIHNDKVINSPICTLYSQQMHS
jgi:hypothetical protein